MLGSRDGKYTGKKIFDGNSFYVHANVTKWRTGAHSTHDVILVHDGKKVGKHWCSAYERNTLFQYSTLSAASNRKKSQ